MSGPEVTVVLPVFEGASFLARSLTTLVSFLEASFPSWEVVVVDDGSTDGSTSLSASFAEPRVRVLHLPANRGKFAALKEGMLAARGRCRVFTDADLPYGLEMLPRMVQLVNERRFHVVTGDRSLGESAYSERVSASRGLASRVFSRIVAIALTGGLRDTQCGLKAFRADAAEALFGVARDPGFSGDVEILYVALKYNLALRRIPVRLVSSGPSTVRLLPHSIRMLWRLAALPVLWRRGVYASSALERLAIEDAGPLPGSTTPGTERERA